MAVLTPFSRWRRRMMIGPRWVALLLGCALCTPFTPAAPAPAAISNEFQIKAVFLFNFAQFVEWPARAFASGDAPLVIGILGEDPFGAYLDELVKGEKVGARPLVVRRFKRPEEITESHILFINRSRAAELGKILERLKGRSVLTVSDLDTFNREGGMVRLATEGGKIRLKINVEAAKACDLTISSKILRPTTIVRDDKP